LGWKIIYIYLVISITNDTHYIINSKVGGLDDTNSLKCVEVSDGSTEKWHTVSTRRSVLGVGVLNNLLYAVS